MTSTKKNLGALALVLLLAACGGEYAQSSIDPKSDFAESIQSLYVTVTVWTSIILVLVWGLLGYVLVRFRDKPGAPHPEQVHGNVKLEIAWTILPAVIVVAIAVPTIRTVFETQPVNADGHMVVDVIGHQFWWEFRIPDEGIVTANEIHLPVGQPIALRMNSVDVLHSFWVPQLGGKRDLNPLIAQPDGAPATGYNWLYFTILEPGEYLGQCAEFCGDSHSLMGTKVIAESQADYDAWVAEWKTTPLLLPDPTAVADSTAPPAVPVQDVLPAGVDRATAEQGRDIFLQNACVICHAVSGTTAGGLLGPNLTGLGLRSTLAAGWLDMSVENIEAWIKDPLAVKPGVLMPGINYAGGGFPATNLDDDQVRAVAQYLYSLR